MTTRQLIEKVNSTDGEKMYVVRDLLNMEYPQDTRDDMPLAMQIATQHGALLAHFAYACEEIKRLQNLTK